MCYERQRVFVSKRHCECVCFRRFRLLMRTRQRAPRSKNGTKNAAGKKQKRDKKPEVTARTPRSMDGMETLHMAAQALEDEEAAEKAAMAGTCVRDAPARARRQRKLNSRYFERDFVAGEGGARGPLGATKDQARALQGRADNPGDDPDNYKVPLCAAGVVWGPLVAPQPAVCPAACSLPRPIRLPYPCACACRCPLLE